MPSITAGQQYALEAAGAGQVCPSGWGNGAKYTDGMDPGCGDCACNAALGGSCSLPTIKLDITTAACTMELTTTFGSATCAAADGSALSIDALAQGITQGACAFAASTVPAKAPVTSTVCTVPPAGGGACVNQAGTCVPDSGGAFGKTCVILPGQVACPSGWVMPHTVTALTNDTRMCSCSCGSASGAVCAGADVKLFAAATCPGAADQTVPAGHGCAAVTVVGGFHAFMMDVGTWQGGSCTQTTTPTGSLQVGGVETVCCLP